ncbi:hypothetical protein F4679DRAFT_249384 [Xylaria curta]|nr:hypothetical protein F4679DRAFT_249384 [Xylaria curta]
MEHTDIIAYVYPHGTGVVSETASDAIKLSSRYIPPRLRLDALIFYRDNNAPGMKITRDEKA